MDQSSVHQPSRWKAPLDLLATVLLVVVALMVGGFVLVDRMQPAAPPRGTGVQPVLTSISIPVADSPTKGNKAARVALVVFSDFQCPVCARAAQQVMPELETQYIDTGKVLLVWRHYPLPIHPEARGAAQAAECGGRQGRFWELHDWAFDHQQALKASDMRAVAAGLGLDMAAFDTCVGGAAAERVATDVALGDQLGVSGTPTWFIGTVQSDGTVKPIDRIDGLGPADVYGKALDKSL